MLYSILLGGIFKFIWGGIYFSPWMWGKIWANSIKTPNFLERNDKAKTPYLLFLGFLSCMAASFALNTLLFWSKVASLDAIFLFVTISIIPVVVLLFQQVLWAKYPVQAALIEAGETLSSAFIIGFIFIFFD